MEAGDGNLGGCNAWEAWNALWSVWKSTGEMWTLFSGKGIAGGIGAHPRPVSSDLLLATEPFFQKQSL